MKPSHNPLFIDFYRLFFNLLYHQAAFAYDLVAWVVSVGLWRSWVESVIPLLDKAPVLELGSGTGNLQRALAGKGATTFGLDESRQMLRQTNRKLKSLSRPINLVNGRSQSLPFVSHSFERVVATFPSEYILHKDTLQEAARVLKPGGTLVIVPFATIKPTSMVHRLAAALFRVTGQAPSTQDVISIWVRMYTDLLNDLSFVVTIKSIDCRNSLVTVIIAEKPEHNNEQRVH